uniref:procollagen-proline 3-dioxygenase n=1 Tax=Salarias fasciatus TaxID=181472 RepID=A0A672HH63_SALFA
KYLVPPLLLLLLLSPPAAPLSGTMALHSRLFSVYVAGVRAYFGGEWSRAAELLEKSIETKQSLFRLRRQCHDDCLSAGSHALSRLGELRTGSGVRETCTSWVTDRPAECLRFCMGRSITPAGQLPVSTDIEYEFSTRNPYNFLQVTYYKLEKLRKAAAAAHTYFVANPSHLEMRNNIEKYRRMKGVTDEDFQDRELENEKHWVSVEQHEIQLFLSFMGEYFKVHSHSCRVQCEVASQPMPEDRGTDGISMSIFLYSRAALSLSLLSCRQYCVTQVATRPGRISAQEDLLPTQLEHLHIAQFKGQTAENNDKSSVDQCYFTTYTTPNYSESNGSFVSDHLFVCFLIQEIVGYVSRSLEEKKLLYFGVENLDFKFIDPDLWTPEDVVPESLRESWRGECPFSPVHRLLLVSVLLSGGVIRQVGVTIAMDDDLLNGTNRVVLDGVATEKECEKILQLAAVAASVGDGYRGRRSPHTPHETFEGLTVLRAVKLAQEGLVNQSDAQLLHELGERVRVLLHSYFRSPSALFISFTHLVCRTAVEGEQEGRLDLSHPVHVDNCLLEPETKQCWKEPPAFIHRDLSAILYLNDNFDGGELFFTNRDAKTVTAQVKPGCGRVVGFSSGPVNPHGVTAVTRGRRCALALWFTKEKLYRDMVRIMSRCSSSCSSSSGRPVSCWCRDTRVG